MKSKASRRTGTARPSKITTKLIETDCLKAKEIHLVTSTKTGQRINMSITTDAQGYPMICMGDAAARKGSVTKQIKLGFDVSGNEHWPYLQLAVYRGAWECVTVSVVDRSHSRKQETYPEASMHHAGRIRTYYRLSPVKGEPWLELRKADGGGYFLSSHGPQFTVAATNANGLRTRDVVRAPLRKRGE